MLLHRKYHRSGFTLLETMIALAVVVMGIGAGAVMNRVIFTASQQSEDVVQASNLADEAIHMLQLTQQYVQRTTAGSKNLSDFFRLPNASVRTIIPYSIDSAASPLAIKWCVEGMGTAGATDSTCFIQNTLLQSTAAGNPRLSIGDMLTNGYESIAVHRDNLGTDARLVVDGATTTGAVVTNASPDWDFYTRKITIMPVASLLSGSAVGAYQATVTVQNSVSKVQVQRTILLTDNL